MEKNWYDPLPEQIREAVFAEMRRMQEWSDGYHAVAAKLSPRNGELAVGGAHFDEFLKGEAIAVFLRNLKHGPDEAARTAKPESAESVRLWNSRHRDYVVHRWERTAENLIDDLQRRIQTAASFAA